MGDTIPETKSARISGRLGRMAIAVLCVAAAGAAAQQPPAQQPAAKPPAAKQPAAPVANERDPKVIEALNAMGKYLRTLKTFSVHSDATRDEVLESGQKIQFAESIVITTRLPDRLRVDVVSDRKQRRYYYDGKTVTQFAPRVGYYATFPALGTVGETLAAADEKYGLALPLADLFYWGTDKSGIDDIKSAIDLGTSRIGGRECQHYAFRQEGVDWQLWIAKGKEPLPCKLLITTTDEPAQPQYTSVLKWDLKAGGDMKAYAFTPPKGAQKIVMAPDAAAKK